MLDPGASGSVCEPFKNGILPYSPMVLLDVSPVHFQSQMFYELVSLVQVPRAGLLNVGHKPLASQRKILLFMRSFPLVGC